MVPIALGLGLLLIIAMGGKGKAAGKEPAALPPLLPEGEEPPFDEGIPGSFQDGGIPGEMSFPGVPGQATPETPQGTVPGQGGFSAVPGSMENLPDGTIPGSMLPGMNTVPGVPSLPGSPGVPAPEGFPGVPGPTQADIDNKFSIVDRAFKAAVNKRVSQLALSGKSESAEQTVGNIRSYFASQGIPIDKSNPSDPFWAQSDVTSSNSLANVVNQYVAPESVVPVAPAPSSLPPEPMVEPVAETMTEAQAEAVAETPPEPEAMPPVPGEIPETPPIPAPVETKVPPTPQAQVETSPSIMEEKRKLVVTAFERAVAKRQGAIPTPSAPIKRAPVTTGPKKPVKPLPKQAPEMQRKIREVEAGFGKAFAYLLSKQIKGRPTQKQALEAAKRNLVPVTQWFAQNGVPAPSQTSNVFWTQPLPDIRKRVARAVSFSYVQTDVKYGGGPVADVKSLRGLHPVAKREYPDVVAGFLMGAAAPRKEARQASVNATAAHFRKMGIPLDKPNPKLAFWRQPIKTIANQLANAVNTLPVPPGTKAGPVTPVAVPPGVPSGVPGSLEEKRLVVVKAFGAAKEKRLKALALAGKRETDKAVVNLIASHFGKHGILLTKPDPTKAFWKLPVKVIADRAAKAVNTLPVPAPAKGKPKIPAPAPTRPTSAPGGVDAASLERKRILVAKAFVKAKGKWKAGNPRGTDQAAINATAAHWKRLNIPLSKPDPRLPFWKNSEKWIADKLAAAYNSFAVKPAAKPRVSGIMGGLFANYGRSLP